MPKFTLEITQHTSIKTIKEENIFGEHAQEISEVLGVDMKENWEKKKFISMMIPVEKKDSTVIFKQSFDEIDLAAIVMMINQPKKGGE